MSAPLHHLSHNQIRLEVGASITSIIINTRSPDPPLAPIRTPAVAASGHDSDSLPSVEHFRANVRHPTGSVGVQGDIPSDAGGFLSQGGSSAGEGSMDNSKPLDEEDGVADAVEEGIMEKEGSTRHESKGKGSGGIVQAGDRGMLRGSSKVVTESALEEVQAGIAVGKVRLSSPPDGRTNSGPDHHSSTTHERLRQTLVRLYRSLNVPPGLLQVVDADIRLKAWWAFQPHIRRFGEIFQIPFPTFRQFKRPLPNIEPQLRKLRESPYVKLTTSNPPGSSRRFSLVPALESYSYTKHLDVSLVLPIHLEAMQMSLPLRANIAISANPFYTLPPQPPAKIFESTFPTFIEAKAAAALAKSLKWDVERYESMIGWILAVHPRIFTICPYSRSIRLYDGTKAWEKDYLRFLFQPIIEVIDSDQFARRHWDFDVVQVIAEGTNPRKAVTLATALHIASTALSVRPHVLPHAFTIESEAEKCIKTASTISVPTRDAIEAILYGHKQFLVDIVNFSEEVLKTIDNDKVLFGDSYDSVREDRIDV